MSAAFACRYGDDDRDRYDDGGLYGGDDGHRVSGGHHGDVHCVVGGRCGGDGRGEPRGSGWLGGRLGGCGGVRGGRPPGCPFLWRRVSRTSS